MEREILITQIITYTLKNRYEIISFDVRSEGGGGGERVVTCDKSDPNLAILSVASGHTTGATRGERMFDITHREVDSRKKRRREEKRENEKKNAV